MVGYKVKRLPSLTFFGDASSKDKEFMVLGGFAVDQEYIDIIESRIASLQKRAGIQSEFHWVAYRGGGRKAPYFALVDFAFNLVKHKKASFHVMLAPFIGPYIDHRSGYDRKRNVSANAAKDSTVNKLYRTLLIHRVARYHGSDRAIQVVLDAGDDSREVIEEATAISVKAYDKYSAGPYLVEPNSVRTMEAVSSKESGIIQMADVIIGGIAASRNNHPLNKVKSELRDYILQAAPHRSWHVNTSKDVRDFTVWNYNRRHEWFLKNKPRMK